RVVANIARIDFLNLQLAGAVRQHARLSVLRAGEDAFDNPDHSRVTRQHDLSPGCLECFRNEPGKTLVVADTGDEGDFILKINRNHDCPWVESPNEETVAVRLGASERTDQCLAARGAQRHERFTERSCRCAPLAAKNWFIPRGQSPPAPPP